MELTINSIPDRKRNITEEEGEVIRRALPSYKIVLGQYERYTDEMKRRDLEKLSREANSLDALNPFSVDMSENKTYEATLEDTKTFVYSSWAEAVANAKTPIHCDGTRKRKIRKQAFMDVQKGKYINRKVKDAMNETIKRLTLGI